MDWIQSRSVHGRTKERPTIGLDLLSALDARRTSIGDVVVHAWPSPGRELIVILGLGDLGADDGDLEIGHIGRLDGLVVELGERCQRMIR